MVACRKKNRNESKYSARGEVCYLSCVSAPTINNYCAQLAASGTDKSRYYVEFIITMRMRDTHTRAHTHTHTLSRIHICSSIYQSASYTLVYTHLVHTRLNIRVNNYRLYTPARPTLHFCNK